MACAPTLAFSTSISTVRDGLITWMVATRPRQPIS
jgi:hypothetical protein